MTWAEFLAKFGIGQNQPDQSGTPRGWFPGGPLTMLVGNQIVPMPTKYPAFTPMDNAIPITLMKNGDTSTNIENKINFDNTASDLRYPVSDNIERDNTRTIGTWSQNIGKDSDIEATNTNIPYGLRAKQVQWELVNEGVPRYKRSVGWGTNRAAKGVIPVGYHQLLDAALGYLLRTSGPRLNTIGEKHLLMGRGDVVIPRENLWHLHLGEPWNKENLKSDWYNEDGYKYSENMYNGADQTLEVSPEPAPPFPNEIAYRYKNDRNRDLAFSNYTWDFNSNSFNVFSGFEGNRLAGYSIGEYGWGMPIDNLGLPMDPQGMGRYTIEQGKDKYGRFASYRDVWDHPPVIKQAITLAAPGSSSFNMYDKQHFLLNPLYQAFKNGATEQEFEDLRKELVNTGLYPFGADLSYKQVHPDTRSGTRPSPGVLDFQIWRLNRDQEKLLKDYVDGKSIDMKYKKLFDLIPDARQAKDEAEKNKKTQKHFFE